jgi:putative ABC transport system permease protein
MDNLFGVPLTAILAVLATIVVIAFGTLGFIAWRNPLLVRMGLRNVVRRRAQTVLIVLGLMLSTLIISAAFATGDTVGYSITNAIYNDLSDADVVLFFDQRTASEGVEALNDGDLARIRDAFIGRDDVDGVTGLVQESVPAINDAERLSEPRALLVGVDPTTADDFAALLTPDGDLLRSADLGDDDAYVTVRLARDINVAVGDEVAVVFENERHTLRVAGIVRDNALTAQTASTGGGALPAGGLVARLDRVREITGAPTDLSLIVLSATGGVRDSLPLVPALTDDVEAFIKGQGLPAGVAADKATAVGFAELLGSIFVTFFLIFGLFSIAAGVMLIFLTFIMLAAERRAEMGMARAIGMKRLHLTESFIAEGMAYNVGSALVGALLGLGVAYLLIFVMSRVFEDFGLNIAFHVNPVGFAVAYCLGVVITFLTVTISSWRAANLNIVRAIRDIDEPQPLRGENRSIGGLVMATLAVFWFLLWFTPLFPLRLGAALVAFAVRRIRRRPATTSNGRFRRNAGGWAVAMLVIGLVATWWGGWISQQAFAYTAGTTLALLAIAMLWVYFGGRARPAFTLASGLLIWYWLTPLPFSLMFEAGKGWNDPLDGFFSLFGLGHPPVVGNLEMFFVSGICITASATLFILFNAELLLKGVGALRFVFGGLMPAIRTAIAYPLAAKFRTGMAIAMFGLVVFSLVVMATLNSNFTQLFLGEDATGGFQVAVEGSPNNRIDDLRSALREGGYDVDGNITGLGTMVGAMARITSPVKPPAAGEELEEPFYRVRSIDAEFAEVARFPMLTRAVGYETDAAVMQALLNDPTVAVVDETRLTVPGAFGEPGAQFRLTQTAKELQDAPWQPIEITVQDPVSGATVNLKVIGILKGSVTGVVIDWAAILVGPQVMTDTFRGGEFERFFVQTPDATKDGATEVARGIESTLIERGAQATSIQQIIDDSAAASTAFQLLFEAFMGLGLIVGIAALGVIAFRSVAERRQQIGMLRAIGYSRRLIAWSFFLESSFIAIAGIGMGVILGGALAYNLMTSPEFTNGNEIDFAFPWVRLIVMVSIAYGASALMTLIPARSASRVSVAEALRYNG